MVLLSLLRGKSIRSSNQKQQLQIKPLTSSSSSSNPDKKSVELRTKKLKRVYPIRKQYIYESYFDLFSERKVIILFRHQDLKTNQWNSIRSQLKSLSLNSTEIDPRPDQLDNKVEIQFLRTRMISPVLKEIIKHRKSSDTHTSSSSTVDFFYKLLDCNSQHLKGNLTSLTSSDFNPSIISEESERLPFLIGIIDQKEIFDERVRLEKRLNEFKGLKDPLNEMRNQILGSLFGLFNGLTKTLENGSGKRLINTLNGFKNDLEKTKLEQNGHLTSSDYLILVNWLANKSNFNMCFEDNNKTKVGQPPSTRTNGYKKMAEELAKKTPKIGFFQRQ
ncbi:hypothetical protein BY996DRAFT_6531653 [Phakopsora pachyrhizi]|nr:hypothetical protein BY996DRAFT_6531653 [Phakopsora pachyrhizi]